jgi:tetratricopeptide (TPR) repeat protein
MKNSENRQTAMYVLAKPVIGRSALLRQAMCLIQLSIVLAGLAPQADAQVSESISKSKFPRVRVLVLPFENATGDPAWNDWEMALPSLTRACLDQAGQMDVLRWDRVKSTLKRVGWNTAQSDEKLAREIATELKASVIVWGRFQRQTNQWIVEARLLSTNSAGPPVTVTVASPGWVGLPEALATRVANHLDRTISDAEFNVFRQQFSTQSEKATTSLARVLRLGFEDPRAADLEQAARQLLAADPNCGVGYKSLAYALWNAGRTNEAGEVLMNCLRAVPDSCAAHANAAAAMWRKDDLKGAERELREALRLHRGCPDAIRGLFDWLCRASRWGDLRPILEQAHTDRPEELTTTIFLACCQAKQGDLKAARELLNTVDDLPEDDDLANIALLDAASLTFDARILRLELALLGPKAAQSEAVRSTLNSFTLHLRSGSHAPLAQPRAFRPAELEAELGRRLTPEECKLVVNPVAITPEIAAEAKRLTIGLTNEAARALVLFADVAQRGHGPGDGGSRTAAEALRSSTNLQTRFSCQEFAKLLVAMARSLDMEAWLVHVDRDDEGQPCYHDVAALFVSGNGFLFDPTWQTFGLPYQEFALLDDLQAISHQALQGQGHPEIQQLRMGLKLNPEDRWTRLQFVRGAARAKEFEEATRELEKVLKTGRETWDTHEAAAKVELEREQWKPALAELQRALALSPSNAVVHMELADAYVELGDMAQASRHSELALACDRGEISNDLRRRVAPQIATLKTVAQIQSGNTSARADLKRLAEQGDALAQTQMANAFFDQGPEHYEEGLGWLLKAAEQGDDSAQYEYARILFELHGAEAGKEAAKWFTRAAGQGHTRAQYRLGLLLYEGKILPRDNAAAGQWILLAMRSDNQDAKHLWQEMELFLSADEQVEARKRAADFKTPGDRSKDQLQ